MIWAINLPFLTRIRTLLPVSCRQQVARELKDLGASLVVTPAELRSAMKDWTLPPPKLGLDCVAGDTSAELAKALA